MMKYALATALLAAIPVAVAQSPVWGQCGGQGWTGATTCASGSVCTFSNPYYSQCIPGTSSAPPQTTTTPPQTTSVPPSTGTTTASQPTTSAGICKTSRTKLKFVGVNQSCAEFGNTVIPGTLGKDYTWPSPSSIDYFVGKGMNTFRVAFLMERLSPPSQGLTGSFDATYLSSLKSTVSYITGKGAFAIVDPHNFMRYNGNTITNTTQFSTWWTNLAKQFMGNQNVIFDLQNEPNGMDASVVFNLMQSAVNAIRSAGASQLILVEGTSWTGAWTWTSSGNSNSFGALKDPMNNVAIEMHQYLDSDGSGTSATCVSSTIGSERISAATTWLKQNNLKGFLGEFGAGSNSACITAIQGMLCDMQAPGTPWIGALWWAAGPWWGTYYQSMEPPSGAAIPSILPAILQATQ